MDILVKLSKAGEEKKLGNEFFKTGNLRSAIKKYHIALLYIKDIEKPNPLQKMSGVAPRQISEEDQSSINDMRSICYNNLAACLLKDQKYEKVIEYTTKTLDVYPSNIKALFRRGEAYMNVRNFDRAEQDFLEIKNIDENETCPDKFFPVIEAQRRHQTNKEKELYKKMMNMNTGGVT